MNKVVLVTGGAQGIGKAIVLELAKNHYDVVINYLTSNKAAALLEEEIKKNYDVRVMTIQADVSKEEEVDAMISLIEKKWGGVDILINNAAVDLSNLFHLKTADEFRKTLDVNVVGAFNCSKRVYRHMLDQEYGRIINISSTNGINTYYPMCIDYDASKAALISLTHNLAFEYGPYINVNAIAPGFIGTDNELDGYDEEFLKEEQEKIMVNRYGCPADIANMCVYLASDESEFFTGQVLTVDGGLNSHVSTVGEFKNMASRTW